LKIKFRQPKTPFNENDSIVDKIFKLRGIDNPNDFLNPTIKYLNDPYLLDNMNIVVKRIEKAIKNNEKIYIYAD
jgi:single-stranded-DNA-specific exonuclease